MIIFSDKYLLVRHVITLLLLLSSYSVCSHANNENEFLNYLIERQNTIDDEQSMSIGSTIVLNKEEERVNNILMKYKNEELQTAFDLPQNFLPSRNFLRVSEVMAYSRVFRVIRKMPKGGVLHAHISAITSRDFILRNITRRPNLYVCRKQQIIELRFLNESAAKDSYECEWELLEVTRRRDKSIDKEIAQALTMYVDEHYVNATGIDDTWKKFLSIFCFIKSLVTYRPVYEDFLYHIMEELYQDNVQFMEVRTPFSILYELNGYQHKNLQVLEIYTKVVDRFVKDHPDFMGIKWIYSPQRNIPHAAFDKYVETFRNLKKYFPNEVIGFDLVGQEDRGTALKEFAQQLLILGKETQFFFHAGETNWSGQKTDENLFDAILLNTKRIGHGYALIKHPKLMELVKKKGIAIEINPISNQVLKLVKDLRNHPASYFFAINMPVVVSNDDPGFWGASALSYDFYEAFIGIMSSGADLRALKQLALNSITYNCMNNSEKQKLINIWNRRWRRFLLEIINDSQQNMKYSLL